MNNPVAYVSEYKMRLVDVLTVLFGRFPNRFGKIMRKTKYRIAPSKRPCANEDDQKELLTNNII